MQVKISTSKFVASDENPATVNVEDFPLLF